MIWNESWKQSEFNSCGFDIDDNQNDVSGCAIDNYGLDDKIIIATGGSRAGGDVQMLMVVM